MHNFFSIRSISAVALILAVLAFLKASAAVADGPLTRRVQDIENRLTQLERFVGFPTHAANTPSGILLREGEYHPTVTGQCFLQLIAEQSDPHHLRFFVRPPAPNQGCNEPNPFEFICTTVDGILCTSPGMPNRVLNVLSDHAFSVRWDAPPTGRTFYFTLQAGGR